MCHLKVIHLNWCVCIIIADLECRSVCCDSYMPTLIGRADLPFMNWTLILSPPGLPKDTVWTLLVWISKQATCSLDAFRLCCRTFHSLCLVFAGLWCHSLFHCSTSIIRSSIWNIVFISLCGYFIMCYWISLVSTNFECQSLTSPSHNFSIPHLRSPRVSHSVPPVTAVGWTRAVLCFCAGTLSWYLHKPSERSSTHSPRDELIPHRQLIPQQLLPHQWWILLQHDVSSHHGVPQAWLWFQVFP